MGIALRSQESGYLSRRSLESNGIEHASPPIVLASSVGSGARCLSGLGHGNSCAVSLRIINCPRAPGVGFGAP